MLNILALLVCLYTQIRFLIQTTTSTTSTVTITTTTATTTMGSGSSSVGGDNSS